ncbi:MAG: ubiquinol oxidase subunit II [Sphingomonadaceae bacterium]|nr:ubiquinol oxidase subunit II [Sphingomonadaceae bacterium]
MACVLPLAGCSGGVLDPQGAVGVAEVKIFYNSLAIMMTVVVPVIVGTLAFAWWFRASNKRARYRPDWTHSGQVEIVVWFIPLLIILLLSGVIWTGSHALDPATRLKSGVPPVEVQVVSLDWKWLFIYPRDGVASVNLLVVPAGTPVHFTLTSGSVMNTFFVPQLGSMIYTMNGMADNLYLVADRPGTYYGRSTMISGDGFPDMQFAVAALPPARFAAWVAGAHGGATLDAAAYRALSHQGTVPRPIVFGSVAPGMFADVVAQRLPPGPGPRLTSPGTTEPKK